MKLKHLDFDRYKYGLFVHYVFNLSPFSDGRMAKTMDEFIEAFDVEGFADQVNAMGVQYLVFTAWHAATLPIYPSEVTRKWRRGDYKYASRDLLGEIIDAINARGIKMILYTHPRDGHGFADEYDQNFTGWGPITDKKHIDRPDPELFDYDKWNEYTVELYTELAERYGDKIYGFYTDGSGPNESAESMTIRNHKLERSMKIVNYLKIRDVMKASNPSMIMLQNYFGYMFCNDYAMPEAYFFYENLHLDHIEKWPAAEKALATCCYTGNWWADTLPGKDATKMAAVDMAKMTIFNSSCSVGGGMCWAAGPYCEGNIWQTGVLEKLTEVGRMIRVPCYEESALNATVSTSYPTISGDMLESLDYRFFTSSYDGKYEYLHIFDAKDKITVNIPKAQDLAELSSPRALTDGVRISSFEKTNGGYTVTIEGDFSDIDTVVRFDRTNSPDAPIYEWVNDSDSRIHYNGIWKYISLTADEKTHKAVGAFEFDLHASGVEGAYLFFAFEGSKIDLYGSLRQNAGKALVFIDGVELELIDEHSDEEKVRQKLFTSPDLHKGYHTIYVVVANDGDMFEFDAFRITK